MFSDSGLISEEEKKKFLEWFKRRKLVPILFIIIVFGPTLLDKVLSDNSSNSDVQTVQQTVRIEIGQPLFGGETIIDQEDEESSSGFVKGQSSKISDFTNWENYEKFDSKSENVQQLYPAFSDFFPEGRTMYSPFLVGSRLKTTVQFRPLSTNRGNIVFSIRDIFQCIIGNGNYKHIDCDVSPYDTEYLIERNQQQEHAWINRSAGIKPMTTQFLTVVIDPVLDSELLDVKLTLKFIPADSEDGQYKSENFQYKIPTGTLSDSLKSQIGLGVIDPEKYRQYQTDKAGFELISIDLQP